MKVRPLRLAWPVLLSVLLAVLLVADWQASPGGRVGPNVSQALTRPNIVLILTDDQSYESVAKMPYLSSRGYWLNYPRAYIENALCCPSRATILTGRYDTHTGVINNNTGSKLDESNTVAVWLRGVGYRTALVGKYLNQYPFGRPLYTPPGWSEWHVPYTEALYNQYNYPLNDNGTVTNFGSTAADYQVDVLRARAVSVINTTPAGTPLFLYFAPTSTHDPWTPAPRHKGSFRGVAMPRYPNQNETNVSDKPAWVRALPLLNLATQDANRRKEWTAALAIDEAVKAIDDALAARGMLTNTVQIFMTDNGYSFGAHRYDRKRCEYEECTHTPFLVRYPGQAARSDPRLVSNVDLASTFCALAGCTPGLSQDGRSLVPVLENTATSWRDGILQHWPGGTAAGVNIPGFYAIRTQQWRYVELATGERELYDLQADPYELQNRHGQSAYAQVEADLAAKLAALKG
jgi:N-acetylglucosamine-6-sulfatase